MNCMHVYIIARVTGLWWSGLSFSLCLYIVYYIVQLELDSITSWFYLYNYVYVIEIPLTFLPAPIEIINDF